MRDQYYRISNERREFFGERYFRLSFDSDYVLQICFSTGSEVCGRGKSSSIGIYTIRKLTFLSNYYGMKNKIVPCTKRMFDNRFDKMANFLK